MQKPGRRKGSGNPNWTKGMGKLGGRVKGTPNKSTQRIREIARGFLEDVQVSKNRLTRLRNGTEHPQVVTLLHHYAYGKPPDKLIIEPGGSGVTSIPLPILAKLLTDQEIEVLAGIARKTKAVMAGAVIKELPDGTQVLDGVAS